MPTMQIKDGAGNDVYIEIDGGAGTLGDPYRVKNYVSLLNASVPVTDNAGSLTVDGTVAFSNTSINVLGATAHDDADTGNPIKIGARAEASVEGATMVADGDRTDLIADLDGLQVVKANCSYADIISERVTNTDGASTAFTNFGAGGAGVRNYVTTAVVYNTSSTNTFVDLRDGTSGSVIFTLPVPSGGGMALSFPVPLRQPTDNTALAFDAGAAASTLYISLIGFQSKL